MGKKSNQFGLDSEYVVPLKSKLSFIRWSKLRRSMQPGGKNFRRPGSSSAMPMPPCHFTHVCNEMLRLDDF